MLGSILKREREIELSFEGLGMEEKKESICKISTVSVRLIERLKTNKNDTPFEERWICNFYNIVVPEGVWNGMKLTQLVQQKIFIALGKEVVELSAETGEIIWKKKYAETSINFIKLSSLFDSLYILYDYYKFESKLIESNLIKVDLSGKIIWSAEQKDKNDSFTYFDYIDNVLIAYSWGGWSIKINENTGEIANAHWTK